MRYNDIYGATRLQRAHRLAANQPPYYTPVPRVGVYMRAAPHAAFTQDYRYVEDLTGANSSKQRKYIVVRSQKFSSNYREWYTIVIPSIARNKKVLKATEILRTGIFNNRTWTCSCQDPVQKCKHVLAVTEKYRHRLRL